MYKHVKPEGKSVVKPEGKSVKQGPQLQKWQKNSDHNNLRI